MGPTTNQVTSQKTEPILQLKRSLLPIDEYAAREGVSRDIIERCGQLGIVRIRRYKDKTFVVDIPLAPYSCVFEVTKGLTKPIGKAVQAKKVSGLVQKIIPGDSIEITRAESLPEPIQPPDWEIFESPDESTELIGETVETEEASESVRIPQDDGVRFGTLIPQAKSKRIWQVATLFLMVFFLAALFANIWFYVDRQAQLDKLDQVYADIQKIHSEATEANQQVEALRNKLAESQAKVRRFQNELDKSGAEVKTVQNELTRAKQNLETVQQLNAKTMERFNKRIQRLIVLAEQTD